MLLIGRYAGTIVPHFYLNELVFVVANSGRCDLYLAANRCEFQGVAEVLEDDLLKAHPIRDDLRVVFIRLNADFDPSGVSLELLVVYHLLKSVP